MKDDLGFVCTGNGGSVHDKVEELQFSFQAERRATLDEARQLHLLAIDKLSQIVNQHSEIQPYLIERPFSYKRIEITISYSGLLERNYDGSITRVMNISDSAPVLENKNHIFYDIADPFTGETVEIYKEPYEEAVRVAQASPVKHPQVHQATELEKITDELILKISKELVDKHHFYVISFGGKLTQGVEEIGAKFLAFGPTTREEARKYELFLADKILTAINGNSRLRPYLKEYPFPSKRLKICLQFRTDKHRFYYDGSSLAHVTLENNRLSYFRINPAEVPEWRKGEFVDIKLFATESYSEAAEAIRKTPSIIKN